jgi:hypothetical protein
MGCVSIIPAFVLICKTVEYISPLINHMVDFVTSVIAQACEMMVSREDLLLNVEL